MKLGQKQESRMQGFVKLVADECISQAFPGPGDGGRGWGHRASLGRRDCQEGDTERKRWGRWMLSLNITT